MSRKDAINSLFMTKPDATAASPARSVERVRTGAVAAMGASLQELSETAKAGERLKQQLAASDVVVSLEPSQIEGSTIADRISIEIDPGFEQLVMSMAEHGQQVPVLVRPHPNATGRFQIAYGRRRLRAAERLGRQVKAIVKTLSDAELVVAQGRENLDRQDLSFIEKALFAKRLEDAGHDRQTIIAALSTDKGDLSRYIAVARRIPEPLIRRIGPAPKSGRARWLGLAEKLENQKLLSSVEAIFDDPAIQAMDSDRRFQALWQKLAYKARPPTRADVWATPQGRRGGHVQRAAGRTALVFNEKAVPAFADFVVSRLDTLFAEFSKVRKGDADDGMTG
ncbi:ParB family protein [Ancylobacter aquaticus]|uniref:ParB family protein n=1 Tax=Ancylobacter aquaticus TaxID=100 RepID=A0A4R1HJH9_ANCAQ|nr:plasmid partitioning protein RepB [Ancylobacter aquaticus]TCK19679.1 ParB family protein [Ancylobacter aquaticus]